MKKITLIVGARQTGKTTLMVLLQDFLEKQGQKTVSLNLDIEKDKQFFTSQETLIKKIELEIGKNKGYVFLDEIQRKENAGLFLKGIYDMHLPYKFIVSGSGSLELKEKIHESLAGRKIIFELGTLSFSEFANFRTNYQYENNLSDFFALDQIQAEQLLKEYLNCGGYPKVLLDEQLTDKKNTNGFLFENLIYKLIQEQTEDTSVKINFWRTTDKAEVDFVLNFGREILPIEAKYSRLKQPVLTRSLRSFIEKYRPQRAFLVNLSLNQKINVNGTEVHFTPFYLLKI